jgi:predicted kinase
MKKLLLITGDLACGKTTFAKLLSKRYDTNLYFKDSLKELLGDTIGFTNREENLKLSKAAVQVMVHIFSEFAAMGKNLILEANFRTNELEQLHEIAARNGYDVLTLLFDGEPEILYERFLHRISYENRHPVHIIGDILEYENFVPYIEKARQEFVPGAILKICADDFDYQTDKLLYEVLDGFFYGGAA